MVEPGLVGQYGANPTKVRGIENLGSFCSWQVRASSYNSNILTNQMQQSYKFITLTFVYSSTCFGRFLAHHQELNDCSGSLWFYLRIVVTVVLCSWSGRPA
jgi:hypothetical protein